LSLPEAPAAVVQGAPADADDDGACPEGCP
jgi:hypothetical protein